MPVFLCIMVFHQKQNAMSKKSLRAMIIGQTPLTSTNDFTVSATTGKEGRSRTPVKLLVASNDQGAKSVVRKKRKEDKQIDVLFVQVGTKQAQIDFVKNDNPNVTVIEFTGNLTKDVLHTKLREHIEAGSAVALTA